MALDIRILNSSDYDDILLGWWKDWGWEPPQKDFLPQDGIGGCIVFDGDEYVCAGFIYMTNSKVVWIDWIISNKNYRKKPERQNAIKMLIDNLTKIGANFGAKYGYALIKHKGLIKCYEEFGYIKGDSYTGEMIKIL
jgi:hypothetical protein